MSTFGCGESASGAADRRWGSSRPVGWVGCGVWALAEATTGDTWRSLRHELDRLHVGQFTGPAGTVHQRTAITGRQQAILRAHDIDAPPRFLDVDPATTS